MLLHEKNLLYFPFRDNFRAIAPALEFQAIDERRSFGNVWISLDLFLFFLLSVRNWERTFFPVFLKQKTKLH